MSVVDASDRTSENPSCPVVDFYDYDQIREVFRHKAAAQDPDAVTGNLAQPDPLAELNSREFFDGILDQVNGEAHRGRRRLLNALVRPEALDRIREDIVLPAFHRAMSGTLVEKADGSYSCDLVELLDRVFLEFSAKLIGLEGVDTEDGLHRLRACVHPIFVGMISRFFEDRDTVLAEGLQAKTNFTEQFYEPSLSAYRILLDRVQRGEMPKEDLPLNLMYFIATESDPAYSDPQLAIRESILIFVAAAGTSVQAILSVINELTHWFSEHPEDAHLRCDDEFLSAALQEAMRLKAPFIEFNIRMASEDFTVGDTDVAKGQEIHLHVPRAGRDEALFGSDADRFNPHREVAHGIPRYGQSFASGPHQCLGLRIVLGNDGRGGSHVQVVKGLLQAGVIPDPDFPPTTISMVLNEGDLTDLSNFSSYRVLFTNWRGHAKA